MSTSIVVHHPEQIDYRGANQPYQRLLIEVLTTSQLAYEHAMYMKPHNMSTLNYMLILMPQKENEYPGVRTVSARKFNDSLTPKMRTYIPFELAMRLHHNPNYIPQQVMEHFRLYGGNIPRLVVSRLPLPLNTVHPPAQQPPQQFNAQQQQQSIGSFINMQQQQSNHFGQQQQQNDILDDESMAVSTAASMAMSTGDMSMPSYTSKRTSMTGSNVAVASAHSRPTGVMSTSPGMSAQQINNQSRGNQSRRQQCSNFAVPSYTTQQTHVGSYGVQQQYSHAQADDMSVAMSTGGMSYTTQQTSMTGPRFANQGRCQQQRFADDASVGANSHMSIDQSVSGKSQQVYHQSGNNMRPFSNDQAGISGYNHQQQLPTINDSIQQSNHVPTGFHSSTPDNGSDSFQGQEQVVHQAPSVWNQYRDGSASSRKAKRRRGEETPDDALPVASLPRLRHNARVNPDLVKKYLSLPLEELMKLEVMQVESEDDMMDLL